MNRESNLQRTSSTSHIGTAEMSLAMWLRNGRAQKNLSLEDVARITKIQVRTLERLEAGRLDGLPAEVFVKGFVRSFARCVGLDEDEALRRYSACLKDGANKVPPAVAARAVIDAMGELAPNARARAPQTPQILRDDPGFAAGSMEIPTVEPISSEPAIEAASEPVEEISPPVVQVEIEAVDAVVVAPPADMDLSAEVVVATAIETSAPTKKKRARKATVTTEGTTKRRRKVATGTPVEPTPVIATADVSEGISAALDAELDVQAEPVAPKRRRKPRGSVQPPVVEAGPAVTVDEASSAPTVEPSSDDVVVATSPIEPSQPIEPVVEWRSVFDLSPINGEISGHVETELPVETASSIEVAEDTDSSTSRFERIEEDAPVQLAWTPRMPPFAITAPPSWRKSPAAPALVAVIDDADPDGAERVLEDRRAGERRRTFLPPILLDRDGDRSGRQGGLTLAVIILLIAATLTLSYLMRRPSASGDGVTLDETSATTPSIG
jgi:hypothetical protein